MLMPAQTPISLSIGEYSTIAGFFVRIRYVYLFLIFAYFLKFAILCNICQVFLSFSSHGGIGSEVAPISSVMGFSNFTSSPILNPGATSTLAQSAFFPKRAARALLQQ